MLLQWVEFLCFDINVHVPHHVMSKIPWYNLRAATDSLRQVRCRGLVEDGRSGNEWLGQSSGHQCREARANYQNTFGGLAQKCDSRGAQACAWPLAAPRPCDCSMLTSLRRTAGAELGRVHD